MKRSRLQYETGLRTDSKALIRLRNSLIRAFTVPIYYEGPVSHGAVHLLSCVCFIMSSVHTELQIQSTLVIPNSKGLSEILRDIRTLTYQIYRTEENIIRTTTFNKYMCNWTLNIWRYIENIVEKRRNFSLGAISPLFHNMFLPFVRFSCLGRDQIFTSR